MSQSNQDRSSKVLSNYICLCVSGKYVCPPGAFALDRKQMKMWRRYNKPGSTFTDIQNHLPLMFHKMPLDVFSLLDFFRWATSWSAIDLGENWFLSAPRITLSP